MEGTVFEGKTTVYGSSTLYDRSSCSLIYPQQLNTRQIVCNISPLNLHQNLTVPLRLLSQVKETVILICRGHINISHVGLLDTMERHVTDLNATTFQ